MDNTTQTLLNAMDYALRILIDCEDEERRVGYSAVLHARKLAAIELLELMMEWDGAAEYGYDWNVEEEFPI